jgi:predicted nucleotidyltransferase
LVSKEFLILNETKNHIPPLQVKWSVPKNRSIDNLETQKKSISMKNSQFFDYLLYAKSKMVLYQICVFGADLKSNMAARVHNVFSFPEILKIFLSETTKSIEL